MNRLHFTILLLTLNLLVVKAGNLDSASYQSRHKFSPEHLKMDFKIFQQTLEKEHGGIYKYSSKEKLTKLFDSVQTTLNDSMDIYSFYKILTICTSQIKCAHTGAYLPEYARKNLLKENRLPLFLLMNEKGAFVEYNFYNPQEVEVGSEIKKINGKDINEIVKQIFSHLSSDGSIITTKYRYLENFGFSKYYNLFIEKVDTFTIEYVTPKGITLNTKILGLSGEKINNQYKILESKESKNQKDITFEILNLNDTLRVGNLKINAFNPSKKFNQFIDSTFKIIHDQSIKTLIIDIRNNGGGTGANFLFSYLTKNPFVFVDSAIVRTRKFHYVRDYSYSSKIIKLLNLFSGAITKKTNKQHEYLVKKNFITKMFGAGEMGIQKPSSQYNYTDKIYLLLNGFTSSEASIFSAIMDSQERSVIIGEESGGNYYGPTSSIIPYVELPNTKIGFTNPLAKIINHVSKKVEHDRGTIPNYSVQESISDRIGNKDTVLNFTLELIKNGKGN